MLTIRFTFGNHKTKQDLFDYLDILNKVLDKQDIQYLIGEYNNGYIDYIIIGYNFTFNCYGEYQKINHYQTILFKTMTNKRILDKCLILDKCYVDKFIF